MKKRILDRIALSVITFTLLTPAHVIAEAKVNQKKFDLRNLALPSEVKDINKASGSVYYNPSVKDKVLIPVHFWGGVNKAGLHFVPVDTGLINGLSMAGGPNGEADLDTVTLTRKDSGATSNFQFDLSEGGNSDAHNFVLKPGDTVFLKKDKFYENRAYYTSLFGVIATVLSSILLYREVRRD